jgi:hypothetical protein
MYGFPTALFMILASRWASGPTDSKPWHLRKSHGLPLPREGIACAGIHPRSKHFRLARM